MNGVLFHIGTENSGNTSYLLDMTPDTSSWTDPALTVGSIFTDPTAGLTFTLLSADYTGANVSVTFSGSGTSACVRSNPSVTLSPASQTVGAGGAASYTVTVTNKDNSVCTASTFNLAGAVPSGLSATFASSALNLAPGSSASTSVQVASSSSLTAGIYGFSVTGVNGSDSTLKSSASGVENVITSLTVSLAADKASYTRNQPVTFNATVLAAGTPVANASVIFRITNANGQVVTGTGTTSSNGVAKYQLRLNKKDPVGTYQTNATASLGTISGSAATSFNVQ